MPTSTPRPTLPTSAPRRPSYLEPSGQEAGPAFGAALCGLPEPLGATLDPRAGATNFAIFSSSAWDVRLCLFTEADLAAGRATWEVPLDPVANRTGDVWHIALPGLDPSLLYGYRVLGPSQARQPEAYGQAYDASRVVLDPYARVIFTGRQRFGEMGPELAYGSPGVLGLARTWPQAAAALPQPAAAFDWEGDRPLCLPMEDLVVYEMHVRGFTAGAASGVGAPGTYAGLVERLDYLAALGVNAIELMPVHEFNELEYYQARLIPGTTAHRYNFWGYSTVGFFAPMARYSAAAAAGGSGTDVLNEFKQLVKECHRRGIEVILDVVFNHTAEGNEMGPTLSFRRVPAASARSRRSLFEAPCAAPRPRARPVGTLAPPRLTPPRLPPAHPSPPNRGLDNRVYYMLAPEGQYYNYSGCGNTVNCNQPVVARFVVDCLRYWVEEMHVDGFRFDLGSILTRAHSAWHKTEQFPADEPAGGPGAAASPAAAPPRRADGDGPTGGVEWVAAAPKSEGAVVGADGAMTDGAGVPTGTPLSDPPLVEMISEDPVLARTKLIAEAWDVDGLNQVGAFPHYGGRWSEWNGHFRDTVRQFVKGTDGNWAGAFASALCGSPSIYVGEPGEHDWWGQHGGRRWKGGRGPTASVNLVTAHDGFTLADLVSYNEKHNEANGEDNRDGESHNLSWNCGEEGPTANPAVASLRQRQMRNMLAALLLANGVPMIYMGDEYGHSSKGGNNNTYCHDSTVNYLDWAAADADADGLRRFTTHMIGLRRAHRELRRGAYVGEGDVAWHGLAPGQPDWGPDARFLALTVHKRGAAGGGLYVAFNAGHQPQLVELPRWEGRAWVPVVDTGKVAPHDVLVADDVLPEAEAATARAAMAMWTQAHAYPMLPWSCVVLESVPAAAAPGPRRAGGAAAAGAPPQAAPPAAGAAGPAAAAPLSAAPAAGGADAAVGTVVDLASSAKSLAAKIKAKAAKSTGARAAQPAAPAAGAAAPEAQAEADEEYEAALRENARLREMLRSKGGGSGSAA
eukprot:scaffold3.g6221.t1